MREIDTNYWTVSEIGKHISATIKKVKEYKNVEIIGEISNIKVYNNKVAFFTLKDEQASLSCVVYPKVIIREFNIKFKNGHKVVVRGNINYFEKNGALSLYVQGLKKKGIGDLHQKYESIKQSLRDRGYFDNSRKKKIPEFPKRIGVVTAMDSAACADVMRTIERRSKFEQITIYDSTVQGPNAPASIVRSIKMADKDNLDVILVCRGGGSFEDLFGFSDEKVAYAIIKAKTPIVTGLGHEVDTSISDLVSDVRCSTPTAAAEYVTFVEEEMMAYIYKMSMDMEKNLKSTLVSNKKQVQQNLNTVMNMMVVKTQKLERRSAGSLEAAKRELELKLRRRIDSVKNLMFNMKPNIMQRLNTSQNRLLRSEAIISEANPEKILSRGFTIIKREDGKVLKSIYDIEVNQTISIALKDGSAKAQIKEKNKDE